MMILRLVLKNNIALLKKGTKEVDLDLNSAIVLLLGRNGYGKSTIMGELSPLPPDNAMYTTNGYKLIEISHENKHYVLESFTGNKSSHSFKVNGKELNLSRNQSTQKELVLEHFNLNNTLFKVLSGLGVTDRFTFMSPGFKKDVFLSLYPNDTKYAMEVYLRLKTSLRDIAGAVKNQTNRLMEEKERFDRLNKTSAEELESKIKIMEEQLKDALLIQGTVSDAINVSDSLRSDINLLKKSTNELLLSKFSNNLYSRGELTRIIERFEAIQNTNYLKRESLSAKIEQISVSLSGVSMDNNDPHELEININLIKEELDYLNKKKTNLKSLLKDHPKFNMLDNNSLEALSNMSAGLVNQLLSVFVTNNETLTLDKYDKLVDKANALKILIRNLNDSKDNLNHQINHILNTDDIECPSCNTKFKPGTTPEQLATMQSKVTGYLNEISQSEALLASYNEVISDNRSWFLTMTSLLSFVDNNSAVLNLNEIINHYKVGYVDCTTLINAVNSTREMYETNTRVITLTEELNILETRARLLKDNNFTELIRDFNTYEALLGEVNSNIFKMNKKIKDMTDQLDNLTGYDFKINNLIDLKESILDKLVIEARYDLKLLIENKISELSPRKDKLVSDLIRSKSVVSVIESIENNLADLKTSGRKTKLLMEGLCPNKGLIGKLLIDFITTVCGNINSVIKDIWLTPLYVKPCNKENGDLNYKFPIVNSDDGVAAGDVGDGSSGEQDILNMVFRHVMIRYHNKDFPLFLDEVGVNLDSAHRECFFNYIKHLSNTNKVKQMFVVSHYYQSYGLLDNAKVVCLTPDMDALPKHYNENCKIKTS